MGNGSEPPKSGRKHRKNPGPRVLESIASNCVTFWLRSADFAIEQVISSADEPAWAYPTGQSILTLWPQASAILQPILQHASETGKSSWNMLPAMGPHLHPMACTCVPVPNATGVIERVSCTFSRGMAERMDYLHDQNASVDHQNEPLDDAHTLSKFLDATVADAKSLTHADFAQIALFSEKEPRELRYEAVAGTVDGSLLHTVVPKGGLSEQVIAAKKPIRFVHDEIVSRLQNHPLLPTYQFLDLQAWMGVPLIIANQCIGLIVVQRIGQTTNFVPEDEKVLLALANKASIIIAGRQLHVRKAALAERESVLGHLLDALPLHIMQVDNHDQVLYMNTRFARETGYQVGDTLPFSTNLPHPIWCNPNTKEPYLWSELPGARAMAMGEHLEEMVLSCERTPGVLSHYLAKAQPTHDPHGMITGAVVVLIDITAQQHAEQQLRQHVAQMDALIQSIQEGIVVYGMDRQPLRYNATALRMFGWDQTDRDPAQLTEPERQALYDIRLSNGQPLDKAHRFPLQQALDGEHSAPMEATVQRLDQKRIIINITLSPLRDPATGEVFGAVGVYRDMTEQYSLERMREEFMNMASHELRTPLTSMVLANHIMQQRLRRIADVGELLKLNDDMAMQIKRLNRLANNLLDLTGLIGNRFSITPRAYDVAQVIREAVDEVHHSTKRAITLQGTAEPIPAEIDTPRFGQVIVNLLSNAIVHSGSSAPVELDVQLGGEATAPRLHVRVRDHGAGIPENKLALIFDRFTSVHEDPLAAASVVTGSGLGFGLYLSRAIIEAHGGAIWAESTVGHGSTFTFEIPLPPQKKAET